jgi:hypothetical protein
MRLQGVKSSKVLNFKVTKKPKMIEGPALVGK